MHDCGPKWWPATAKSQAKAVLQCSVLQRTVASKGKKWSCQRHSPLWPGVYKCPKHTRRQKESDFFIPWPKCIFVIMLHNSDYFCCTAEFNLTFFCTKTTVWVHGPEEATYLHLTPKNGWCYLKLDLNMKVNIPEQSRHINIFAFTHAYTHIDCERNWIL